MCFWISHFWILPLSVLFATMTASLVFDFFACLFWCWFLLPLWTVSFSASLKLFFTPYMDSAASSLQDTSNPADMAQLHSLMVHQENNSWPTKSNLQLSRTQMLQALDNPPYQELNQFPWPYLISLMAPPIVPRVYFGSVRNYSTTNQPTRMTLPNVPS